MRAKSGAGKRRSSKLLPHPSAMAFNYLPSGPRVHIDCFHHDDGVNEANNNSPCSGVPKTSDLDTTCQKITSNTSSGMAAEEETFDKGPVGICEGEVFPEIDWTEKEEVCLKCETGGKMLVCSDSDCSLTIHEECMPCPARFDSMGNFYCPYCLCKQARHEISVAREKVLLAKKALSAFLGKRVFDGDPLNANTDAVKSKEQTIQTSPGIKQNDRFDREFNSNCPTTTPSVVKDGVLGGDQLNGRGDTVQNKKRKLFSELDANGMPEEKIRTRSRSKQPIKLDRGQKASVSPSGEDLTVQDDDMASDSLCEENENARPILRRTQQKDQNAKSSNDECLTRTAQKISDKLDADEVQKKKTKTRSTSKQPTINTGSPDVELSSKLDANGMPNEERKTRSRSKQPIKSDGGQKASVSPSGEDSMKPDDDVASDSSHEQSENARSISRHTEHKYQNAKSSKNECLNQSARKLSNGLGANKVQRERSKTKGTSKQPIIDTGFPDVKRKRRPWTVEEEEMLREGVEKFSTTVNKNLPWRKILDFGRHVFHCIRTPSDLKDKWRNLLAKESSTR